MIETNESSQHLTLRIVDTVRRSETLSNAACFYLAEVYVNWQEISPWPPAPPSLPPPPAAPPIGVVAQVVERVRENLSWLAILFVLLFLACCALYLFVALQRPPDKRGHLVNCCLAFCGGCCVSAGKRVGSLRRRMLHTTPSSSALNVSAVTAAGGYAAAGSPGPKPKKPTCGALGGKVTKASSSLAASVSKARARGLSRMRGFSMHVSAVSSGSAGGTDAPEHEMQHTISGKAPSTDLEGNQAPTQAQALPNIDGGGPGGNPELASRPRKISFWPLSPNSSARLSSGADADATKPQHQPASSECAPGASEKARSRNLSIGSFFKQRSAASHHGQGTCSTEPAATIPATPAVTEGSDSARSRGTSFGSFFKKRSAMNDLQQSLPGNGHEGCGQAFSSFSGTGHAQGEGSERRERTASSLIISTNI